MRAHLPTNVQIFLFTDERNWPFFNQTIWHLLHLHVMRNTLVPRSVDQYSQLLMNCDVWRQFSTDYVLVFQSDARLCSGSPHTIEQFVNGHYPYIGAPWHADRAWKEATKNSHVGNGGLSLRSRAAMLEACTSTSTIPIEDIYFSHYFKVHENRWPNAPVYVAEAFSVETYFAANQTSAPFAIHKPHTYINDARLRLLCPEYDTLSYSMLSS
jgi:hypothetical protein